MFTFQSETPTNRHIEVEGTGKDIVGMRKVLVNPKASNKPESP